MPYQQAQKNIPAGWQQVKLDDCLTIKHGKSQKQIEVIDGKYPILATGGVIGRTNTPLYSKPSVLIGRKGTIDKPRYMDTPFWTVDTLFYSQIKDNAVPKYLFYKFNTIAWYDYNEASGVPSLSATTISAIKCNLPPLTEQNRIVAVLEAWDKAIEMLTKKIEFKKQVKKGLMQSLLTGKLRLPGFEDPWRVTKFSALFTERNERGGPGLQLLSITSSRGVIYQSDSNKKDTSNSDKSKYLRICPGDIGYNTMRMWQGRNALSSIEGLVSPAYTILSPRDGVDSRYFAYLFKMPRIVNYFFQKSQGLVSDTWQCRYKDFSLVKYSIPEHKEQSAIADVLITADKEIQTLDRKLISLQEQKRYLLNSLITGSIRTPETLEVSK